MQQLGPDHLDTSQSLNNLAMLYYEQGNERIRRATAANAPLSVREQQVGA